MHVSKATTTWHLDWVPTQNINHFYAKVLLLNLGMGFIWIFGGKKSLYVPNGLVSQPACITLFIAIIKGCQQLLRRGNLCPNCLTSFLGPREGQFIAARVTPIVEYNPWKHTQVNLTQLEAYHNKANATQTTNSSYRIHWYSSCIWCHYKIAACS